jgi:hypothetical protein
MELRHVIAYALIGMMGLFLVTAGAYWRRRRAQERKSWYGRRRSKRR